VRCLLTGDQPRTERHDWSRLDAAPSTMRAWQIHTRDADSGPTRSPSSASAALFAK
jgi:hypothetical protein